MKSRDAQAPAGPPESLPGWAFPVDTYPSSGTVSAFKAFWAGLYLQSEDCY